MRSLLIRRGETFDAEADAAEVARALAQPDATVWLDVCDPDDEDLALLRSGFGFHPLAIEDATRSHERPKVDTYSNGDASQGSYYFVVFYAATFDEPKAHVDVQALNLFIGPNYLVTVHVGEMVHVNDTMARWRAPDSPMAGRVSMLVHALLDEMVDDYFPLMDRVADRVEELEDAIFVKFNTRSIQTIFGLKKSLLGMRRVVAPERDVLNVLLRRQLPVFAAEDVAYLQDVYDHIVRVTDNVDTYRDLLSSALDSYLSLQSNSLNQVMKVLTIASIVLMSNSLIAGIYGMNFHLMPELNWALGYPWALGLMVVISVAEVLFFKRRDWL